MVPFKSFFMHDPQIPNLYLANLESGPFLEDYWQGVKWGPENFAPICPTGQKLWHFFEVTEGQTDRQKRITPVP